MKKKFFLIVICFALIITSLAFCLTGCSNIVKISKKKPLDLTGMELVFEDNFDGDLNSDVWATTFDNPIRRGGYWTEEQTFTKDGSLIIRTEYKENGSQGAGWYTGTCLSQYKKEFTYGYFEAKCKAPAAEGLWSAFWMQAENMAQNLSTDGGKNGAEIDIMESPFYNDPAMTIKYRNTTLHTIHVDGYGDDHKATNSKYFEVNKDIYNEFIESSKIDVKYNWFCKVLSDFRIKYIYNLTESEYKKQMQAISQAGITTPEKKVEIEQPKILAAKISESERPAQPKEQEKVENKKDVPADEKPSDKIPKWKQEGFNSLNEYFDYLKTQSKSIPEEKKGFVYETSIVK